MYIHELKDWPGFRWDQAGLTAALAEARHRQGRLLGRMEALGLGPRAEATLRTLTQDVIKTSEIEGEHLDAAQVRSSIARRLGMDIGAVPPIDRHVEGIVEVMLDATGQYDLPLTEERLFAWHAALFPTGRSGMRRIAAGAWRTPESGPMQVVSGPYGQERVHYEAPDAGRLPEEMARFLQWFNSEGVELDPLLGSALAHFWFVTIHPFDDGNGRLARAIADLVLARSERSPQRFYSVSAQIQRERRDYYAVLEASQKGSLDITPWMDWFLRCFQNALTASAEILEAVLSKARFWEAHAGVPVNDRQRAMLNWLLNGFTGKLTTSKWAKLAKCSQDSALRDIGDLVGRGILVREEAGGRSTSYRLGSGELRRGGLN